MKDSSSSDKGLRHPEETTEMEKGIAEPRKNLEVKRRLVVTRLTSEEHRATLGCRDREKQTKLESQLKCEIEVSRQLSAIKLLLKVDNHKIYY